MGMLDGMLGSVLGGMMGGGGSGAQQQNPMLQLALQTPAAERRHRGHPGQVPAGGLRGPGAVVDFDRAEPADLARRPAAGAGTGPTGADRAATRAGPQRSRRRPRIDAAAAHRPDDAARAGAAGEQRPRLAGAGDPQPVEARLSASRRLARRMRRHTHTESRPGRGSPRPCLSGACTRVAVRSEAGRTLPGPASGTGRSAHDGVTARYLASSIAACAAASRAIGTRNGEQLT